MKKLYTIVLMLFVPICGLYAQSGSRSIAADDVKMTRIGDEVTVAYTLSAGKKATKANSNLVVNPVLRSGAAATTTVRRQLSPIIIRGCRSKVLDARHELATGKLHYEQTPVYMHTGESIEYSVTLPYESWMSGGQLIFEGVSIDCCSSAEVVLGLVADNILDAGPQFETKVVEVPTLQPRSTGEQLAVQYPFLAPVSEFELIRQVLQQSPGTPDSDRSEISERVIAETRDGSVSIFFDQGLRVIDSNFGNNKKNLVELISAIRAIAVAQDSEIAAIVIAGFASPEGSAELNERLAWDRAVAVKEFLTENSDIDPRTIRIFSGGADWAGLKELVENSDLYQKRRIIDIIDNTPVWDSRRNAGRLGELMRLDGGEPYRHMLKYFFPELRQAAYIKIYFEDKYL